MTDTSILDAEAIQNLRALGDEMEDDSFLKEVVGIYLTDTPKRLAEIHDCLASGDQTTFNRAAHSIKGSSSNLGAIKVIRAAKRLEEKSKESLESLEADIAELVGAFAEAKTALESL
jgi:HPt (histidine-containing phosphotransfer) domain-containing protein